MLVPPTNDGYHAPDPHKLKNRKINSGPRRRGGESGGGGTISSIWTETPEEKRRRLENAVLGRGEDEASTSQTTSSTGKSSQKVKTAEDLEREKKIEAYTASTRGR